MCRSDFVRVLIRLQEVVSEGGDEDEAPEGLSALCNAMVIDQENAMPLQVFLDDDYELLASAALMNPNIALVVSSYPQLQLASHAA